MKYILSDIKDARLLAQANAIMEDFDFEKISKVMQFLNWGWGVKNDENKMSLEVPNVYCIINFAESLLAEVAVYYESKKEECVLASGGFEARVTKEGDLILLFVVEEAEEYADDYEENGKLKKEQ